MTHLEAIDAVAKLICKNALQGDAHSMLSDAAKIARINVDQLVITTCGPLHAAAAGMMSTVGYTSRPVMGLTLDTWNDYDNGHTLIEVYVPSSGWQVYDLTNKVRPKYLGGRAGITDFNQTMIEDKVDLVPLWHGAIFDQNWDYYAQMGGRKFDLITWYKRVLQVPMIWDGSHYRFETRPDNAENTRIEGYSSSYLRMAATPFYALRVAVP